MNKRSGKPLSVRWLTLVALFLVAARGNAQDKELPPAEIFVGMSLHGPDIIKGWEVAGGMNFKPWLALVGDIAMHYDSSSATLFGLTGKDSAHLFSSGVGPRISFPNRSPFTPFGQFVIGAAVVTAKEKITAPTGTGTGATTTISENSEKLVGAFMGIGPGLDIALSPRTAVRFNLEFRRYNFTDSNDWSRRASWGLLVKF